LAATARGGAEGRRAGVPTKAGCRTVCRAARRPVPSRNVRDPQVHKRMRGHCENEKRGEAPARSPRGSLMERGNVGGKVGVGGWERGGPDVTRTTA
jgi:hypothetical protein